ncbi:ferric reductase-like transmembrane domain-containing protein [Tateyamaria sp.]|uniref:ferric reductase-like transmembrane domain-containing protein n=1 Tax=Tateyamaria sp. TaxID=1929288 RepID=UPI003B21CD3E
MRALLTWAALITAIAVPLAVAATSPLLAWRQPIYIAAGFAGVIALALLLIQPLLAAGHLPGPNPRRARKIHRWVGATLVAAVFIHVGGLWITSPGDVIDALTFTSPTPFSAWGVIAMWAVFAAAVLAIFRKKLRLSLWRALHGILALCTVYSRLSRSLAQSPMPC